MTKYKIELFVTDGSLFGHDWGRANSSIETNLNAKAVTEIIAKAITKIEKALQKGR